MDTEQDEWKSCTTCAYAIWPGASYPCSVCNYKDMWVPQEGDGDEEDSKHRDEAEYE